MSAAVSSPSFERRRSSDEEDWEKYFQANPPPPEVEEHKKRINAFIEFHSSADRCDSSSSNMDAPSETLFALVTSGGTAVPIEHNTVRFLDNFSQGLRGASSAEEFLKKGYRLIFLYRAKSLQPFARHFSVLELMDDFEISSSDSALLSGSSLQFRSVLRKYKKVKAANALLCVPFVSLSEYLWYLRYFSQLLSRTAGPRALIYLAAAVADFYLPREAMPEHKLRSDEPMNLKLELVPKMMKPLISLWAKDAFIVSFKLETTTEGLVSRAQEALEKYKHHVVIANELKTRKSVVTMVTSDGREPKLILLNTEAEGVEIEELIVDELLSLHQNHIHSRRNHPGET